MLATVARIAIIVPVVVTKGISTVMQKQMDDQNKAALLDPGARKILSDLANVPSSDNCTWVSEVQKFIGRYGALRDAQDPDIEVLEYARRFREIWAAKSEEEYQRANGFLEEVFVAPDQFSPMRPIADFATGRWEPRPRTLLEHLIIEIMHSRKMLHRCERSECKKYFVKAWSRDRYCSNLCGEKGRASSLERYHEKHREERNAKRRKPQKQKIVRR
jgi:hypothetical protein